MTYRLPDLPYAFDALEPHIDARTMEIHHGKHHAAYVANLNAALDKEPGLYDFKLEDVIANLASVPEELRGARAGDAVDPGPPPELAALGLRSAIVAPLTVEERVIGTLGLFAREEGRFDETDADFLSLAAELAAIGIEKGKPFKPDARMKKILNDAMAIANGAARAISYFPRDPGNLTFKDSEAWVTAYADKDTTFTRNGAYRLDPRVLFHFGYICVSPAMAMTAAGKGSDYSMGMLDSEGKVFDGSKTYKLHIPPNPPAKDFWAITMYDTQTRSQLQTDQQFPTLGSQTEGVQTNADGSYDIYFAPKPPEGKEGNWLQTIPGKSWWLALRMYGPLEPWIKQTWRPGEIELVE